MKNGNFIGRQCDGCHSFQSVQITPETSKISCPSCKKEWGEIKNKKDIFDYCPVCSCRQFYLSKNFNQLFGCITVFIAILLVTLTYGLSLPVFALIDWLLYRRIETIAVCYRCAAEFHGYDVQKRFKPFMHHIGLKYDKYR